MPLSTLQIKESSVINCSQGMEQLIKLPCVLRMSHSQTQIFVIESTFDSDGVATLSLIDYWTETSTTCSSSVIIVNICYYAGKA